MDALHLGIAAYGLFLLTTVAGGLRMARLRQPVDDDEQMEAMAALGRREKRVPGLHT